jgi:sulfatase maturation enzyme AslB (radical SAM superfamily)
MSTRLSDLGLKRSTYLISSSLPNGDIRLMSTLWKSVVDLDSRHYSMLLNQPFEATDEDMHDLAELERIRILVREDIDEFSLARTTIESWKRAPMLSVTYCLTYACNMACSYCIQKRDNGPASPACAPCSADDVAAFVLQGLSFYGLNSVEVVLFGGEPTLE